MVNYAEDADVVARRKSRTFVSAQEAQARREARNAARSEAEWRQFARDAVYRQLGVRDKSVSELRTALRLRDVPDAIIEDTISSFIDSGLVNDETFAYTFVRNRFEYKALSRRALAVELRKRGISSQNSQAALAQITDEQESDAAREFAMRKIHSMRSLELEVARRRLYGALARRGFSSTDIRCALASALEELRQLQEND